MGSSFSTSRRLRHLLEWLGVWGVGRGIPLLPRQAIWGLGGMLGRLAARVDRRGMTVAMANLEAAFPGSHGTDELRCIATASYCQFSRTFLDLFWSRRLDPRRREVWTLYSYADQSEVEEACRGGALFITPHYGNFEWMASLWPAGLTVIAQDFKNPRITPLFAAERTRFGNSVIPQERAFLRLLKSIKRGSHAGLLPDLTTKPGKTATTIEAFGMPLSVTVLPAALAARTGCPVIPALCRTEAGGRYRFEVGRPLHFTPEDPPHEVARRCWQAFEPVIREDPAPWLWMYKHWRYLPADVEASRWPFYANRSKAFDRQLERDGWSSVG